MTKLSKEAIQQLLESMASRTEAENPFDLSALGQGKLHFDAITIEVGYESSAAVFWFKGKKLYSMGFPALGPGNILRLDGIAGSMDFSISN